MGYRVKNIGSALLNAFHDLPSPANPIPRKVNVDLLEKLLTNIYRILFTHHHILGWVQRVVFSRIFPVHAGGGAVPPANVSQPQLQNLRTQLERTARSLLAYFPIQHETKNPQNQRNTRKELQRQWDEGTLRTEIPPETILELSIQCLCTSLVPGTRFPQLSISGILENYFGAATDIVPQGLQHVRRGISLPLTIFLALDQPRQPPIPIQDM